MRDIVARYSEGLGPQDSLGLGTGVQWWRVVEEGGGVDSDIFIKI